MLTEILWRLLIGKSLHITWEYSSYAMSGVFLLGASYTLYSGAHVRVTSVLEFVPSRVAHVLEYACTIIGLAISGLLTMSLFVLAWTSFQGGVVSFTINRVPLAYPQFMMTFGAAVLTLQFVARLLRQALEMPMEVILEDDNIPELE
jgi:TRAP-type C4-dicarboxylate transport system permease small subunit